MARYSRPARADGSTALLVIVAMTAWTHCSWVLYALYGIGVIVALLVALAVVKRTRNHRHDATLGDIDVMDGLDFERYVAVLLRQHGFRSVSLTERYDMGVDIVAKKNGVRWGIQVKRCSGLVKAAAVRQVVTALNFYGCDRAMVVTNSTFNSTARWLAESNQCVLIDRSALFGIMG